MLCIYFKLSWLAKFCFKFGNQVKSAVSKSYNVIEPRVIFFCKKNATSDPIKFLRILVVISEEY